MELCTRFQMYACGPWGLVLEIHELSDWNKCGAERIKTCTSENLMDIHTVAVMLYNQGITKDFCSCGRQDPVALFWICMVINVVNITCVFLLQAERISLALSNRVATDRPRPFPWSNCPPWLSALFRAPKVERNHQINKLGATGPWGAKGGLQTFAKLIKTHITKL